MGEVLIGTSGFYYNDWKGAFYPAGLPSGNYLEYYTENFSALELNYTYYRLPEARQTRDMVSRSREHLEFVVKAFRGMTHDIPKDSLEDTASRFIDGIAPLKESGQLGGILLQFPQSFHYTQENRFYLKYLLNKLEPFPLFVEFRGKEWLRENVYKGLKEMNTGFVNVDEPDLSSLLPPMSKNTSDRGYIRFHGRNRNNWYGTDSVKRYDYLYSEEELRDWLSRIKTLKDNTKKLYVFFNNHARAQAVTNAKMLMNLINE